MGISYALLMFVASEVKHIFFENKDLLKIAFQLQMRSLVLNAYHSIMIRMGMKIQTALTTAVYRKV